MHTNRKTNFSNRKKSLDLCVCGILDPAVVQDLTKFPSSIKKVLLQLVRDIIDGV